jgi:hypothetical protein
MTLTPLQQAQATYDEDSPRTFLEDLAFYMENGYVYSGRDFFIMARPITRRDDGFVLDYGFNYRNPNAWFVYLAAGKNCLKRFIDIAPFKTEWVCWHKDKAKDFKLKYHKWINYEKKVNRYGLN